MERIVTDPHVLAGKPVVRGTRIPVYLILNLVAHGKTTAQIMEDYPDLIEADIKAAIEYAARHMKYEETMGLEVLCCTNNLDSFVLGHAHARA